LLALDAHLIVRGDNEEGLALSKWTPRDRTLILRVLLPALRIANTHVAYEKVARTPADQPIVCVAARATMSAGKLISARIALGGVGDRPVVIEAAEMTIDRAMQLAVESINPPSDYFASADYRREMIGVLVKRVLSH
jgi:CO/xanthine dehydrogenase FAD-binding subunit